MAVTWGSHYQGLDLEDWAKPQAPLVYSVPGHYQIQLCSTAITPSCSVQIWYRNNNTSAYLITWNFFFCYSPLFPRNLHSVTGVRSCPRAEWPRNCASMPACVRDFSLLQSIQACSGAHLATYSRVRAMLLLGGETSTAWKWPLTSIRCWGSKCVDRYLLYPINYHTT